MSKLNSKTLMVAAAVLMVLALLFMASPLLRVSGLANRTGFPRTFNGQAAPGGQNSLPGLGNGTQGQGNPGTQINPFNPNNPNNSTGRQFANRGRSLFGLGLLTGITGTIFYGIALLVSLAAAVGMFLTKRWGQVLGIVMGVVYLILALVGFIPTILLAVTFARGFNVLSLGLNLLHVVLAVAVIVLALIPAKKMLVQAVPVEPVTPAAPPAASA